MTRRWTKWRESVERTKQIQAVAVGVAARKRLADDNLGQLVVGMPPSTSHEEPLPCGNGREVRLRLSLTKRVPKRHNLIRMA